MKLENQEKPGTHFGCKYPRKIPIDLFVVILLPNGTQILPRIQTVCRPLCKWFHLLLALCWQHWSQIKGTSDRIHRSLFLLEKQYTVVGVKKHEFRSASKLHIVNKP